MWDWFLRPRSELAAVTAERDALLAMRKNLEAVNRSLEARIYELREGQPNGGMSVDEAWSQYHEAVEIEAWRLHVQDPATPADDRPIISSWAMKGVFGMAWELKRCT